MQSNSSLLIFEEANRNRDRQGMKRDPKQTEHMRQESRQPE